MINGKYYESDYEEAFIEVLQDNGWDYAYGENIHRQLTEGLIETDLAEYLTSTYTDLTDNEVRRCIAQLRNTAAANNYLTARAVIMLYRQGFTLQRDDTQLPDIHIDFIDFETAEYNIFKAVNQFTMIEGKEERRPDVLLFINGIPVCIIELKNPTDPTATIHDAWEQIHIRYRRDINSLLRFCALSCISDGANSRLGTPFTPYAHYYAWKKVENEDEPAKGVYEMNTLIAGAFSTTRIIELLRDFVYFPDVEEGKEDEKQIVCRYPQYFATIKLFDNILRHVKSHKGGDGKGGTYFGATGCGKTFTMLFLARRLALRAKKQLGSPTILIIVDREDLQTQSGALFCASKDFLEDENVREIVDREDLKKELSARGAGGVYVMTIQKFCEEIGFLNDRANIICLSDEAHRTQTGTGEKLKVVTEKKDKDNKAIAETSDNSKIGAFVSYGFAYYLRTAFPKATFVGFTGTPIDETIHVFGDVVDRYTMKQAVEDEITVDLKYAPRLARVIMDAAKAKQIEDYYKQCEDEGTDPAKIAKSKQAMASMNAILGEDGRLGRVANDIVTHYDAFTANRTNTVTKAMIVCSDRKIAFNLYKKILAIRPDWFEPKRVQDESKFVTPEEKEELLTYRELPMINLVATQGSNDEKDLYDLCGDKAYRKMLDKEFKKEKSNFRIAIVVDMWITGFDVPSLTILYNDKPLQRHSLIQTISRVNRKYQGKDFGLIVDYLGIRDNMQKAMKQYGGEGGATSPDDVETTYKVFVAQLEVLKELFAKFCMDEFFKGTPLSRLTCLQAAAEFVLEKPTEPKDGKPSFKTLVKGHVRRLKMAYDICQPAGRLDGQECAYSQFFMAVQSLILKMTLEGKDEATMNKDVAAMVQEAINCTGVETVLNASDDEEIFSDDFMKEIDDAKLPNTKFQMLVKVLKQAIRDYGKTNKAKARQFEEMLQQVIDEYNKRDKLTFTNNVATDTVNAVTDVVETKLKKCIERIKGLFGMLKKDKLEFQKMGITFEEKAFYDILIEVRDKYHFDFDDNKCKDLAKKINDLIAQSAVYADFLNNNNIRAKLSSDLTDILYKNGYPPEWNEEIFTKVLAQVENFKTYN